MHACTHIQHTQHTHTLALTHTTHAHSTCTQHTHTTHAHNTHTAHAHNIRTQHMHTAHAHNTRTQYTHTTHAHSTRTQHTHNTRTQHTHTTHAHNTRTQHTHSTCTHHTHTAHAHNTRTQHTHTTHAHNTRTQHTHTTHAHSTRTQPTHTTHAHNTRTQHTHTAHAHNTRTQHTQPHACSHTETCNAIMERGERLWTDIMTTHFVLLMTPARVQFKPSEEHIRVVRLLMKRVHYFANGFSVRCADSHLVTITDNLRRCTVCWEVCFPSCNGVFHLSSPSCSSVIPVHFRSSLYFLLLHALKHWSFDITYRYVSIIVRACTSVSVGVVGMRTYECTYMCYVQVPYSVVPSSSLLCEGYRVVADFHPTMEILGS